MGKINLLSDIICNRIAAGEVIERPYSVVKELVENSIDAGSTAIDIYIERGGKDMIKVVDNGCGIEKDDMRAAFFSHATSKIKELDDINHIKTLGFRGEALATICAVALVELISKVDGADGNRVECDGEFVGKVQPAAVSETGTQIMVKNLFFNTPVRFKFMKSDKKEETDITSYVTKYILLKPNIAFKYYVDGNLKLQSYGGGLEEAITQVYGAKVLPNCFKIDAERNEIKLRGFISNQQYFKPNKTYQTLFLNERYVNNQVVSSAINNAYGPYTMKKNFPFYVLFVDMPDEFVDVNVHPNKTDVRFSESSLVYGSIYKTIGTILDGTVKATEYVVPDDNTGLPETKPLISYAAEYITDKVVDKDFSDIQDIDVYSKQEEVKKKPTPTDGIDLSVYDDYEAPQVIETIDRGDIPVEASQNENKRPGWDISIEENFETLPSDFHVRERVLKDRAVQKAIEERRIYLESKYRGTLFNTYIIYEMRDDVYIIDQHAAHERIIYDKLMQQIAEDDVIRQPVLAPYIIDSTPEEFRFLEENRMNLFRMGFLLEHFGPKHFRVSEIPACMGYLNVKEFFDELLKKISDYSEIKTTDIFKEKIAQQACKHAVKGGDKLTEQERDALFEMVNGRMGLKCPHGRPICIKLSKNELEKMFKRKL